jgi:lipoprotein signal peptidase
MKKRIGLIIGSLIILVIFITMLIQGNPSKSIFIWISAILTLAIYSFLYKDNVFYKFAEHLFVGVSVGYGIGVYWQNSFIRLVFNPLFITKPYIVNGQFHPWLLLAIIIPTLMGLLMLSLFTKKQGWLIRIPIAFVVGAGSGMSIPASFQAYIFEHAKNTLYVTLSISSFIMIVGVITTLVYFFFSKEHKGLLGKTANLGIWFIMIAFGASFGYTVMARISLLIGRMNFLLHDWLGVIK